MAVPVYRECVRCRDSVEEMYGWYFDGGLFIAPGKWLQTGATKPIFTHETDGLFLCMPCGIEQLGFARPTLNRHAYQPSEEA